MMMLLNAKPSVGFVLTRNSPLHLRPATPPGLSDAILTYHHPTAKENPNFGGSSRTFQSSATCNISHGRIDGQTFGVIRVVIARKPAIYRLPD
jgi:hypothetical protein